MFIKFEPVINTIKFLTEIPFNSTSEAELPSDMRFNSAHVISIVGYGTLFVVSSIANLVIVLFNIIEVKIKVLQVRIEILQVKIEMLQVTI